MNKSFEDLIRESEQPVLVDFWAEWCGACRMMYPVIRQIAATYKGRLITIKINVDRKPVIATQYQIAGIPTVMLFHRGKVMMRLSGVRSFDALRRELEKHLPLSSV
ncbi:MAG TPA: thioredoxin [bacterium]|nr:thioredoxin [bacterium]